MPALVSSGMLLDITDKRLHILNWSFRQNSMAEIKNVPWPAVRAAKHFCSTGFQTFPTGKQEHGIEITLNGSHISKPCPAFIERHAPVEAYHVCIRGLHLRQQRRGFRPEIDDRSACRFYSLHQLAGPWENVSRIVIR